MGRQSVWRSHTRFHLPAARVRRGVQVLYGLVEDHRCGPAQGAFEAWRQLSPHGAFKGDDSRAKRALDALRQAYDLPANPQDLPRAMFALQSWLALLAKCAVWEQLARTKGAGSLALFRSGSAWQDLLSQWEAGDFLGWDVGGALEPALFGWPVACWNGTVAQVVECVCQAVATQFARCPPAPMSETDSSPAQDLLAWLYQSWVPRPVRHALGEYYTPRWLVRLVFEAAGYPALGPRVLDPTCGTGAFLVEAIARLRAGACCNSSREGASASGLAWQDILEAVAGMEANPLAVVLARLNVLRAVSDLLPPRAQVSLPVRQADAVFDRMDSAVAFDYVLGNPPWIAWDDMPEVYRQAARPLWQRYGLLSLSAREARHGGSKKDLAILVLYAAADRYLRPAGRLAMLVPQTVFQTRGAGDGFRRFRLGEGGEGLGVVEVHDLVAVRPFDAANWTAAVVLEKGRPTTYPVRYVRWSPRQRRGGKPAAAPALVASAPADDPGRPARIPPAGEPAPSQDACGFHGQQMEPLVLAAWPVDPRRPRSPWVLWPGAWSAQEVRHPLERLVGPSDYEAHLGANTAGANGVYWLALVDEPGPGPHERHGPHERPGPHETPGPHERHGPHETPGPYERPGPHERRGLHERLPSCGRPELGPATQASLLNDAIGRTTLSLAGTAKACAAGRRRLETVLVRNLVDCGKQHLPAGEHRIEAELVYPLLRWGDIQRFRAQPSALLLLVQDPVRRCGIEEEVLRCRYPCAHAYLAGFRPVLERRAAYRRYQARGPFYAMYDVGPYTLAPIKVVWRRMDRQIQAAVVGLWDHPRLGRRPVVPQETCVLVSARSSDEAHYLCALLNSSVVGFLAQAHSIPGGKAFGSPGMLEYLNLRRFDRARPEHRALASCSRRAHRLAARGDPDAAIIAEIDRLVGRLYGLDAEEVARMAQACCRGALGP